MTPPRTFVVLSTQRSGSSWLVDLLNSHPEVAAYDELFYVGDRSVTDYGATAVPRFAETIDRGSPTSQWLVLRRHAYLRRLADAHRDLDAVGFKLMYDQAGLHPGLLLCLWLWSARFVHLVRADHLAAIVSWEAAEAAGRFRVHDAEEVARPRLHLDPSSLLERIAAREREVGRWCVRLERLRRPVLEVRYEDLVDRREEELARILRFLEVEARDVELGSSLVRSGTGRLAGVVVNDDEIRSALAGTRYEWMAREELNSAA